MVKADGKKGIVAVRPMSICVGAFLGLAIIMVLTVIGAGLISSEKLSPNGAQIFALFSTFVGTLVGGFYAAKRNKRAFLMCGAMVGVLLYALRILAALSYDECKIFGGYAIILLAVVLLGGIFGGLMGGKKKNKRKR